MVLMHVLWLNQNFLLWTLLSTGFLWSYLKLILLCAIQIYYLLTYLLNNIDVVKSCQLYFGFSLPSEEWVKRAKNLDAKYIACERAFVYSHLISSHLICSDKTYIYECVRVRGSKWTVPVLFIYYYGSSMFYWLIMLCRRVCHCIFYIVFAI